MRKEWKARVGLAVVVMMLLLGMLACDLGGGGWQGWQATQGADATATFAADQFNAQLTAVQAGKE